jgi:hypothetical protein
MYTYVPDKPGEFYAQEAAVCYQKRGESNQVQVRGMVHIMGPDQGQKCIYKKRSLT